MHTGLARALGTAALGAGLGIVGTLYTKFEPGGAAVMVVAALGLIAAFALIYGARAEREEFLDAYEDCQGECKGKAQRRMMWRLPDHLRKKKGLPVCSSCYGVMTGRNVNPFEAKYAYARKGEEYGNTKKGKLEFKRARDESRRILELIDPNREKRAAEMLASEADPRSPQSPKRGPCPPPPSQASPVATDGCERSCSA